MIARDHLLDIFRAALSAVEPYSAVLRHLRRDGNRLILATSPRQTLDLTRFERVLVLGAGKAAAPMAKAVEEMLGDALAGGLVVVKDGHTLPLSRVECREAGHPIPDENGLRAGDALLALASRATKRDLVLCLLSGGGSALLESLPPALTLADLQAANEVLLGSGATITEVNTIRKHLSRLKGGRLAEAIAPAMLVTLVLSDVIGSPLTAIASGPTVPDSSTWDDVKAILTRYTLWGRLPEPVLAYLRAGTSGDLPDTPKHLPPAPAVIIGDNARALHAAAAYAATLGFDVQIEDAAMEGEASEAGRRIGRTLRALRQQPSQNAPLCLLYGGETTVTLGGRYGLGGRNQELALAAAIELDGVDKVTVGAFATDGADGPTDSAGAIIDGGTVARGGGRDAAYHHLVGHDAYPFLASSRDNLHTGPTLTNVNDLVVALVDV